MTALEPLSHAARRLVRLAAWGFMAACARKAEIPAGTQLWAVPTAASDDWPMPPASNADRSMIYFATGDRHLRKVRARDGVVVWDMDTRIRHPIVPGMTPVVSGGVVALARVDIAAYDTATGAPRWLYAAPDREETGSDALSANDSTIFAAGRLGRVHAIDASTGRRRWTTDLARGASGIAAFNATVASGMVFACTRALEAVPTRGTLWALDEKTGDVRWSHAFTPRKPHLGSSCYGAPVSWHDLVIQPQEDGRTFALERETGRVRWIAPAVDSTRGNDLLWAGAAGDAVVVTSQAGEGAVVAYDAATGAERWRRTDMGGSMFATAGDAGTVFIDHGARFAAYDASTGALRWATPAGERSLYVGRPLVTADRLFIAGTHGAYALAR